MRHLRSLLLLVLVATLGAPGVAHAVEGRGRAQDNRATGARSEGRRSDLRGLRKAAGCVVHPGGVECFRSEAKLIAREQALSTSIDALGGRVLLEDFAVAASCSTPLRLYDGTSFSGTRVSVYTRGVWVNLGSLGFDNRTSSYIVGACAVELAKGTGGSGDRYPRCLYAGCQEATLLSGWNNTISSVYLR